MRNRLICMFACSWLACADNADISGSRNKPQARASGGSGTEVPAGPISVTAGVAGPAPVIGNQSSAGTAAAGATAAATSGGGAVQPPSGSECGAVTQMAQNKLQPVDIIIGVDTSGSMAEEVAEVQAKLNAFSEQIIASGIDVSVILVAALQGSALVPLTVDGPCIAAPLGSGMCPADNNPPRYVHVDTPVGSWDVLDVYVAAYPQYKQYLREGSLKSFVTITDDNAVSPFGMEPPVINSADKFMAAIDALEPAGSAMWASWRYSAIYCFTACPAASLVGTVHADLVMRTQGVGGDLCLQDFGPVFDELAKKVADTVALTCDWEIPPPPGGETFDPGKTNVQLALDGAVETLPRAADMAGCGDMQGWYYDDAAAPRRVVACPATCSRIQAASDAKVDLLFGCETVVLQ